MKSLKNLKLDNRINLKKEDNLKKHNYPKINTGNSFINQQNSYGDYSQEKSNLNQYDNHAFSKEQLEIKKEHKKRDLAKKILIEEYNFSRKDAELKIREMELNEKKLKNNLNNKHEEININTPNKIKKPNLNQSTGNDSIEMEKKNRNDEFNKEIFHHSLSNHDLTNQQESYSSNDAQILQNQQPDIDEIIQEIIPYYEKQVSIELEHVDLIFEVSDDKIDNIKEQFIRTLKRSLPKSKKFQALKDITFKIYKGEKVGIIGYNGAGKSTLLNVITGIYPPNRGKVKTYGKISPLLSLGAGFDYNYSGARNIFLNGAILGYDKKFLHEKYNEIVEFSELGEFIDYPIKNYSSGMLAKLGFSIATIVNPDILIIDEILGVGDVNFQKKSADKIRSLMDSGTTVLLVSHSIPQIRELCDKAIWIDQGQVKEIGEVNKVCDDYLKDSEKASRAQLQNIRFK